MSEELRGFERFRQEWGNIRRAPFSFFGGVVIVGVSCWALLDFLYASRVDALREQVALLERRLEHKTITTPKEDAPANSNFLGQPEGSEQEQPINSQPRVHSPRPKPLPDGRFSLQLLAASPFDAKWPTLTLRNNSAFSISYEVARFSVKVNDIQLVRAELGGGMLKPQSTDILRDSEPINISHISKGDIKILFVVEIDYKREGGKYTNRLEEFIMCTPKNVESKNPLCTSIGIRDEISERMK